MLEIRLLGPLEIIVDGVALPAGPPKQQVVLAMMAIRPGRMVAVDELVDELWPDGPPASAVANTRGYAANLRRMFEATAATRELLVRRGSGYELRVEADDVDLTRFVAEGRQVGEAIGNGNLRLVDDLLVRMEGRWRGPLLAGAPLGPVLSAHRALAEERRLGVVEQRAELILALGQPSDAIALLREHLRTHPLREHGHALMMRALYQDGDVAGALAAFTAARSVLVELMGIEPGPELQHLHKAVLNRELMLERVQVTDQPPVSIAPERAAGLVAASQAREAPAIVVPTCWLPRPLADFTGRADTVRRLVAEVEGADPAAPVIQVIDGMAGIGKTALAVHVANCVAARFPDAQLFIDLQGHSTARPVEPATALATLLRQLGIPAGRIPPELDHRVALWRSELAVRRVIVLLDNAGSRSQVEPLLPSAPGVLVLLTSRRRLLATEGVSPKPLPLLGQAEAVELLAKVAGWKRTRAEPEAAASVVRRCGYLPLAIRLVGARLAHRPGWRVADLAQRLDRDSLVLAELSAEDQTVASAFAMSYKPLGESARRMFRLLGLYPGEFFQVITAAALTGLPLPDAEAAIMELVDHHLVEEPSAGRFRLHDLMHQYARGLAMTTESALSCRAAIEQVLDHYLHAVAIVSEMLELPHQRTQISLRDPLRPELVSAAAPAIGWMEAERANIRLLIRLATEGDHADYAWQIARFAWRFHFTRGYSDDIIETHRLALSAAERSGDVAATAMMHNYIASAYLKLSDYRAAIHHLGRSTELRRSVGDEAGERVSQANLAVVLTRMGRIHEAVDIFQSVRRGGLPGIGTNMGVSLMLLGRYEEALRVQRICLFAAIEVKRSFAVTQELGNIGAVRLRMGQFKQAARLIRASLALRARTNHWYGEAAATNDLGSAYRHMGRLREAQQLHRRAITCAGDAGERDVESAALNDLGLTLAALGQATAAVEAHQQALELATRIGHPYEQGRALAAIANRLESRDPAEARRHWERASAIFGKMGVPERFEVERRLGRLSTPLTDDGTRAAKVVSAGDR